MTEAEQSVAKRRHATTRSSATAPEGWEAPAGFARRREGTARPLPSTCEALREILADVEVDAATLRRDPQGRTWLPADAQAWVRDDPECAAMLAEFVAGERELFAEADVGSDPFFTARVLDALPPPLRFTGLTPRGRAAVLAVFHVIAGVVAYGIFVWLTSGPGGGVPDYAVAAADGAHDMVAGMGALGVDASAPWLTAVVLVIVALVAFVSSRSHGPSRPTGAPGPT